METIIIPLNIEFLIEMFSLTASNTMSASATAEERRPSAITSPCEESNISQQTSGVLLQNMI